MLIYKDINTGEEVLSNAFSIEEDKPCRGMLTVTCGKVKTGGSVDVDIGANASQEEEQEQLDDQETEVIDVVDYFKLAEIPYEKSAFKSYIKPQMKLLLGKIKEQMADSGADEDKIKKKGEDVQKDAQEMVKWVLEHFKDLSFYVCESFDEKAMVMFMIYDDSGIKMYYFKHAYEQEKC